MTVEFFLGLVAVVAFSVLIFRQRKKARRLAMLQQPLAPEYLSILIDKVPLYSRLPDSLKQRLQGCINYFLDEKVFVGCAGFEISDEVRITIAGNACMLVLNREPRSFPGFKSILVYPETYVARQVRYQGMVEIHEDSARAGESWHGGPVVLSWSDIQHGSQNRHDGHNVILHEFAHKLDEENNIMDGLPVLRKSADYQEWARVLTKEYAEFIDRVEDRKNDVIDEYGAVSAPEFFAVATESFFEKSKQMKEKLPELYHQFQVFFALDPAGWTEPASDEGQAEEDARKAAAARYDNGQRKNS